MIYLTDITIGLRKRLLNARSTVEWRRVLPYSKTSCFHDIEIWVWAEEIIVFRRIMGLIVFLRIPKSSGTPLRFYPALFACEMINMISIKGLAKVLSVTESTIAVWTKSQRDELVKEKERKILELHLHAENTQQDIADILNKPDVEVDGGFDEVGEVDGEVDSEFDDGEWIEDAAERSNISKQTVNDKIRKLSENTNIIESGQIPEPYIYNIWSLNKQTEDKDYFGAFPEKYMENLLYYHTDLFDIIYDPFAGSGTTIGKCCQMTSVSLLYRFIVD